MRTLWVFPIAAGLLLTGCVVVPTGPSVMVLPGNAKDFEQFKGDDACLKVAVVEFPDLVARCRASRPCDISKTPAGINVPRAVVAPTP